MRLEPGTTKNLDGREFPFFALPQLEALLRRQREATTSSERDQGRVIPRGEQVARHVGRADFPKVPPPDEHPGHFRSLGGPAGGGPGGSGDQQKLPGDGFHRA